MATSNRGFAAMSKEERTEYARRGGLASSGSFDNDRARASKAGKIGAANQPIEAKRRGGRNSHRNR